MGGGTGMICNEFKGGIGTSSRVARCQVLAATPSVCWCNAITEDGRVADCRRASGKEIPEHAPDENDTGSIIVVVATDAPLIPTQLKRVARRVSLGLGRDGSFSGRRLGRYFYRLLDSKSGCGGNLKAVHQSPCCPISN